METVPQPNSKASFIKTLYLYLVSFVALMMLVVSAVDILNIILKTFIFTKADNYDYYAVPAMCETRPLPAGATTTPPTPDCIKDTEANKKSAEENRVAQRQRDLVRDISMFVVGIPLFAFHWKLARRKEV